MVLILFRLNTVKVLVAVRIRALDNGEFLHALGDDFTGHSSDFMEISVPQLDRSLNLEPSQTNKQTVDNTSLVFLATSSLGSFNDILRDKMAVWVGQDILLDLAANDLLNLVFQSQCNFSNLLGRIR